MSVIPVRYATIDALGALLGASGPARPWHPQDGRVTRLSLHCWLDPVLGNDVDLLIHARPASSRSDRRMAPA